MISLLLALAAAPAPAKPEPHLPDVVIGQRIAGFYSPAHRACLDKAVATLDMTTCSAAETRRWDARLNKAYRADLSTFNAAEKADLTKAQRAWIAYRDANCAAYEQPVDWGSMSRITASECMLRMTVQRAFELENFPPSACGKASC